MERTHLGRWIAMLFAGGCWVFGLLALASFQATDWPSHAVYPTPPVANLCGWVGAGLAYWVYFTIGQGIYPFMLFSGLCIAMYMRVGRVGDLWLRAIGLLILCTAFSAAVHHFSPGSPRGFPEGQGGIIGIAAAEFLHRNFSAAGSVLVLILAHFVGLLLAADDLVLRAPGAITQAIEVARERSPQLSKLNLGRFNFRLLPMPALPSLPNFITRSAGDDDDDSAMKKPILLRRHNLSKDEIDLTYENDEPAVEQAYRDVNDPAPSAAAEMPAAGASRAGHPAEATGATAAPAAGGAAPTPRAKMVINGLAKEGTKPAAVRSHADGRAGTDGPPAAARATGEGVRGQGVAGGVAGSEGAAAVETALRESADDDASHDETLQDDSLHDDADHDDAALGEAGTEAQAGDEFDADGVFAPPPPNSTVTVNVASAAKPKAFSPPSLPPPRELGEYKLPEWDVLAEAEHGFAEAQEKFVREKAAQLEQALREFNIDGHVVSIDTGPVITMYEIALAPGVKVATITSLSNDIARALSATSVRIVAPVPGKNTVGIEVPNVQKEKVRLKELMQLAPEARNKMTIPLYLGKDASGAPLVTDLCSMPHCLIAGTTGSGKSVCINTIILSVMYMQRPDMVKLVLIDPKVVEMAPFKDIPHLMCPVINDCGRATSVLEWACTKMDERYELLAEAGVRNLAGYNKLTREELIERFQPGTPEEEAKIPKHLPYIVIIIDELADLMMTSGKEVESFIVRLAQKSRAVGIHLILATQRPQANVVTGLIKANMPSRIAFRVASRMDSRIVLDQNGADLLLGQGDMLFLPNGANKPIRSQGTFIDDLEIRSSVKLVKSLAEAQYEPELVQIRAKVNLDAEFEHDDLWDDAVRIVLETRRGSVSLLQRRLSIGYARASRLIERMAATGIVGEYKGSQSREAAMTLEEWDAMQAQQRKDAESGMTV